MTLRNALRLSLPLISLLIAAQARAVSVATEPLGYVRSEVHADSQAVGFPLVNPALYAGTVSRASGDVVSVSSNTSFANLLANGTPCYLEITSGPLEGERFDIDIAATRQAETGSFVISQTTPNNNTLPTLPASSLAGASFVIRPHVTLGEIGNMLTAGPAAGDSIATLDASGQLTPGYVATANGTWLTADTSSSTNQQSVTVAPGSGVLFSRAGTATELIQVGAVRTNAFRQNLRSGFQLVAAAYPVALTPAAFATYPANAWTASNSADSADQIRTWTDGQGFISGLFLSQNGTWTALDGSQTSTLEPENAFAVVRRSADNAFEELSPVAVD